MAHGTPQLTTPIEGLRPLVFQGTQAASCYNQLTALLQGSLGEAYADLFAEPIADVSRGVIDWYLSKPGKPVRLVDLPEVEQEQVQSKLATLMAEVGNFAQELAAQRDSNSQMAGNLLELALSFPSKESVYVLGGQPFLINWGYAQSFEASAPEVVSRLGISQPTAFNQEVPQSIETKEGISDQGISKKTTFRFPWRFLLYTLLGVLVTLLLLLGFSRCSGFVVLGPEWESFGGCSRQAVPGPVEPDAQDVALALSIATTEQLQHKLAALQQEYLQRLGQCPQPSPEPVVPKEIPPAPEPEAQKPVSPPRKDKLEIPHDAETLDFLEGCWYADSGLRNRGTGLPVTVKFCFGKEGKGDALIQEFDSRGKLRSECKGRAKARLEKGRLFVDDSGTVYCPDGSSYRRNIIVCKQQGRTALCRDDTKEKRWKNVPFVRTERGSPPKPRRK